MSGVTREVDGARITEGWTVKEEVAPPAVVEEAVPVKEDALAQVSMAQVMASGVNSPVKLIFKDADISIGEIIVRRKGEK